MVSDHENITDKSKLEDQMNQAFINWSQTSNKDDQNTVAAVQTGASVPESLEGENKIFSINGDDFERMQNEVPNYLKLDNSFDYLGLTSSTKSP